jgi:hypothetical protein
VGVRRGWRFVSAVVVLQVMARLLIASSSTDRLGVPQA